MDRVQEFFSKPSHLSPYPVHSKQRGGAVRPFFDSRKYAMKALPVANTMLDVLSGALLGYMINKKKK